jgi:hypothetical protein
MTKDRVLIFFDKYVAEKAPYRRKLCVQVFSKQHEERMNDEVGDDIKLIKDPVEFKRDMGLYPLPKKVVVEVHKNGSKS